MQKRNITERYIRWYTTKLDNLTKNRCSSIKNKSGKTTTPIITTMKILNSALL